MNRRCYRARAQKEQQSCCRKHWSSLAIGARLIRAAHKEGQYLTTAARSRKIDSIHTTEPFRRLSARGIYGRR